MGGFRYLGLVELRHWGVVLSFDPNLRPPLWSSLELAKKQVRYGMSRCDIVKISDNEIQWLSGLADYDEGIAWLRRRMVADGCRGGIVPFCGKPYFELHESWGLKW